MDKDHVIIATFVDGELIGIVDQHVAFKTLRVHLGLFRDLDVGPDGVSDDQVSSMLRQISEFVREWQPASRDAASSRNL